MKNARAHSPATCCGCQPGVVVASGRQQLRPRLGSALPVPSWVPASAALQKCYEEVCGAAVSRRPASHLRIRTPIGSRLSLPRQPLTRGGAADYEFSVQGVETMSGFASLHYAIEATPWRKCDGSRQRPRKPLLLFCLERVSKPAARHVRDSAPESQHSLPVFSRRVWPWSKRLASLLV